MKTYQSTRSSKNTNRIVEELNAAVCPLTFASKTGTQKADLYRCPNSVDVLVGHNTCAPVYSNLIKTVNLLF